MIDKPKKERRFLKTLGKIGEILIQEVLIKIGSNLIKKIGGKKTLPSILFLLASLSLFAQYPATGNKQRLGYQTSGDGLVFRGRTNDTTALKPSTINNAYFILDTVNNVLFNYIKTKGGWVFNNTDTVINNITVDTTSLSNRINLKLNISDTASMLTPYFKDADTTSLNLTSRFAAKLSISDTASMLTNYLRTGVAASTYQAKLNGTGFVKASGTNITYDNSTYLTTGTAASTYLPLTGGALSKTTTYPSNDSILTKFFIRSGANNFIPTYGIFAESEHSIANSTTGIFGSASTQYGSAIGVKGRAILNSTGSNGLAYGIFGEIQVPNMSGNASNSYAGYFNNTSTVSDGNHYGLYVNTASGGDYGIYQTGSGTNYFGSNTSIGGTLGVTGATTLSAPLTVNSSAVFNEGSTDSDFRVESDGNANMVFVDASTDRVGIGTNAPDKTLHVNGEVKIATVTATPTSLLGKDASNVVGEVTDINQSGIMKVGGTTATTNSVGGINVAHGLSYTPSKVIATIAQLNSYVIVLRGTTSSNLEFTIYDSTTGVGLDTVSVGFYWIAFK